LGTLPLLVFEQSKSQSKLIVLIIFSRQIVFAILLSTSLLSSLVTFATKDLPTAVSSIYLLISILLGPTTSSDPAPQITVTVILCAVLQGVAVASGYGWSFWKSREQGKIRLEDGEGDHAVAA